MNKVITSLLVILIAGISLSNAQNLIYVGSSEYQSLKESGALNLIPKEQIVSMPREKILNPDDFAPQALVAGGGGNTTVNCTPFVPVDNTFGVPEFTSGLPPDYRNDDGSSDMPIILPFDFCFYGQNFNSVYINNNGNISFNVTYGTFTPLIFPNNQFTMLCPFWADVDTRNPASGIVSYQISPTHLVVRWENVGYFNSMADKLNDFQLIITEGTDPIIPGGNNVAFSYGDMQWTTGSASGGVNGFGGSPAIVGANQGNGINSIMVGTFDHAGTDYDGPFGNPDGISWLDNKTLLFNVCQSTTNLAPVPDASLSFCDTIFVCIGDSLSLNMSLLSPEQGQTTVITIDTTGVPDFILYSNTPGNTAVINASFYATLDNVGMNTITITATDDGTPVAQNVIEYNIFVSQITNNQSSTPETCEDANGAAIVTNVSGTVSPYQYSWSPSGGSDSIATNLSAGTYVVTITSANGCVHNDTIIVDGILSPTANFGINPPVALPEGNVTFTDSSLANGDTIVSWFWDFGNGVTSTEQNPAYSFADTGHYPVMLIVTNTQNCTDTIIIVIPVVEIIVPNIFTPNGDGFNDMFVIPYMPEEFPNSKLYIYSRWGKRVYKSDNYQNDWDGDKHPEGTYFYTLYVSNGTEIKGTVTILK